MSGLDLILLVLIAAGCFFALRKIYRGKKSGCGGCGNCGGCSTPCRKKEEDFHE